MRKSILVSALVTASVLSACTSLSTRDISRETLAFNDGWAATGAGTTGGTATSAENIFTVTTRKQLVDALTKAGDLPKIIKISGTINLSSDDSGRELTEKDYAVAPYNFGAYMNAYAPAVWNVKLEKNKRPSRDLTGPQEEARIKSAENQKKQIVIHIPSNTTIVGLGKDAKIVKGNLFIGEGVENVIIRNITFEDAFDYFPQWDPGDSFKIDTSYPGCQETYVDANTGPQKCPGGRWNSEYDNISINGGKRVWIDHCTFSDGDRPDQRFPPVFPFPHNEVTQKVQHHDGLVDVTNGGDLVTLSFNHFREHDKTSLIGGSDNLTSDAGKLNVTYHNNWFENIGQRMPRVRFGKVHTWNNYFSGDARGNDNPKRTAYENHLNALKEKSGVSIFRQALGAGKNSAIYSENNYFEIRNGGAESAVVNMGGSVFLDVGSMVNGQPANLLAAANSVDPKRQLKADLDWKPTLYSKKPLPAADVPAFVKAHAGAGKL